MWPCKIVGAAPTEASNDRAMTSNKKTAGRLHGAVQLSGGSG